MLTASILFFLISLLIALVAFVVGILYIGAKRNKQATFVEEGTMKFVVKGDSLDRVLLNVSGYSYDEMTKTIENVPTQKTWLEDHGIYWVSWLYPLKRVHTFEVIKDRLKMSKPTEPKDIDELVEHEGAVLVDNLRFQFTRPFVIREVDFADGTRVDFLIFGVFQVVNPYQAVFIQSGKKMFNILASSVQALLVDYAKDKGFEEFRKTVKGKDFFEELKKINEGEDSIISIAGIKAISGRIEEYNISPKDQAIQDAIQKKDINTRLAEARVAEADGIARSKERIATAEGTRFQKEMEALRDAGVDPNVAANTLREIRKAEHIASEDSKVTTWVEGGAEATPKTVLTIK